MADRVGNDIEREILAFAEEQWGNKTLERLANKLAEETGEVAGAVVKIPEGRATHEDLDKELGDVLIVVAQFAVKRGTTLDRLLLSRYGQIRKRAHLAGGAR